MSRMGREPPFAAREQLVDLVAPHPVMLVVVEHRDEHVEVPEQVLQPGRPTQRDVVVRALTPRGPLRIQWLPRDRDLVAERTEEALDHPRPTAAGQRRYCRLERDRGLDEVGAILA